MRIVGGRLRGRSLAAPKSQETRPTTDRTRESLFNIIAHSWPEKLNDTAVLDLFAGTGALGIEAISRGARFCLFVEQGAEARGLLRTNTDTLGLNGCTKIYRRDATHLGPRGALPQFSLVFADPPYGKGLGQAAFISLRESDWLTPDALLVLEEAADAQPQAIDGLSRIEVRTFGQSSLSFWSPVG